MRWIQKQQGYPYFNERYERQMHLKRMTTDDFMKETEEPEKPVQPKKPPVRYDDIVIFSMPDEKKNNS